jgi:WD40 repeat protein/tRNA A-37 threonylcarbamoyl transferase component Bud32
MPADVDDGTDSLFSEDIPPSSRGAHPSSPSTIFPNDRNVPATQEFDATSGERVLRDATAPDAGSMPAQIAGYQILEVLGHGGMGVVYKARQLALNRLVALKMVLAGEHASPQHLARFLVEAETVARLSHPNIVQIHEFGSYDGQPFLALEYIDGGALADRIAGRPWEPRRAAALCEQLARAVDHAHRQGVVHRDLKPGNVLLTAEGTPKVADFGLAKQIEGGSGLTSTGAVLGTPSYMAPEQAGGHAKRVGPATDIYSLGAILYELLTGRPPPVADTSVQLLVKVVTEEVVEPTRLQPGLPVDLATICMRCLQKDPARRYRSASDLADDLRRYLQGEPILARPVGEWERFIKWAKRRPAVAASLLASVVILLLGTAVSLYFGLQATQAKTEAIAARNAAQLQTAELLFDRGQSLCEQGEPARGIHWLLASLRQTPASAGDFQRLVLTNLAAWDQQLNSLELLVDHPKSAWCLAFSPDGRTIASGCHDGLVRRWDLATGQPAGEPLRHPAAVGTVTFSPDGKMIIASYGQGGVGLAQRWQAATATPVGEPVSSPGGIASLHYSPDGKEIVTASHNGTIQLWDAATGRPSAPPVRLPQARRGMQTAFSPDGRWLLAGTAAMNITDPAVLELREVKDLQKVRFKVPSTGGYYDVAFHPGGRMIVTGDVFESMVRRWDVETGKPIGEPLFHSTSDWPANSVPGVRFSPDGRVLMTLSFHGGLVRFCDGLTGEPLGSLGRSDVTAGRGLELSPDGRFLGVSSDGLLARPGGWPMRSRARFACRKRAKPLSCRPTVSARAFRKSGALSPRRGSAPTATQWPLSDRNTRRSSWTSQPVDHSGPRCTMPGAR